MIPHGLDPLSACVCNDTYSTVSARDHRGRSQIPGAKRSESSIKGKKTQANDKPHRRGCSSLSMNSSAGSRARRHYRGCTKGQKQNCECNDDVIIIVCYKQNQHNNNSGNKTLQLFYNTSLMTSRCSRWDSRTGQYEHARTRTRPRQRVRSARRGKPP